MSNKEILQQNNTRLSENNTDLASILNIVNGLPEKVDIRLQEKTVTPSTEQQEVIADEGYTGLEKVTVDGIVENNLEIIPSSENQNFDGVYTNVAVVGDENLTSDNIKKGVSIFGVEGNIVETKKFFINNCDRLFYQGARIEVYQDMLSLCKNATTAQYMFSGSLKIGAENLRELDLENFDTSELTNTYCMFSSCSNLTDLDLSTYNTNNITNMREMFYNCESLSSLNMSSFDLSKVTNIVNAFNYNGKLSNFVSFKNLGKGFIQKSANYSGYTLNFSNSTKLTYDSLMDIINNGLYDLNLTYDVANGGTLYTQKLTLGSTNLAKLTSEEIAVATNKGWTVS